ncbi:hypothetical protein PO124_24185 [Bacillus licheniformis]|nr:hypothetical protein [Bacillus licheniformis]
MTVRSAKMNSDLSNGAERWKYGYHASAANGAKRKAVEDERNHRTI